MQRLQEAHEKRRSTTSTTMRTYHVVRAEDGLVEGLSQEYGTLGQFIPANNAGPRSEMSLPSPPVWHAVLEPFAMGSQSTRKKPLIPMPRWGKQHGGSRWRLLPSSDRTEAAAQVHNR